MKLSIIILNFNSQDFTDKCLKSLAKFPLKSEYEILIIDNASKNNELEKIRQKWENKEHKNIKFIHSPKNLGYGQGNELAIKQAKGEYVAVINPDIEVNKNTLDGLLDFLDKNPKVGLVGPRLYYKNGSTQDSFRRFPVPIDLLIKRVNFLRKRFQGRMAKFLMWDVDFKKPIPVDWVVGAFFVMRKKAWEEVGGFDPRYFLFFEDTDICRTMWKKGWEVYYNPLYTAIHNHERLSETSGLLDIFCKKTVRTHIASGFKYFFKWGLGKKRS